MYTYDDAIRDIKDKAAAFCKDYIEMSAELEQSERAKKKAEGHMYENAVKAAEYKLAVEREKETKDTFTRAINTRFARLEKDLRDIGGKYKAEHEAVYSAAEVDSNTMMLLNMGTCKAADFKSLYDAAETPTMQRIIRESAKEYSYNDKISPEERAAVNQMLNQSGGDKSDDVSDYIYAVCSYVGGARAGHDLASHDYVKTMMRAGIKQGVINDVDGV